MCEASKSRRQHNKQRETCVTRSSRNFILTQPLLPSIIHTLSSLAKRTRNSYCTSCIMTSCTELCCSDHELCQQALCFLALSSTVDMPATSFKKGNQCVAYAFNAASTARQSAQSSGLGRMALAVWYSTSQLRLQYHGTPGPIYCCR